MKLGFYKLIQFLKNDVNLKKIKILIYIYLKLVKNWLYILKYKQKNIYI